MSSGRGIAYRVELTERSLLDLEAIYAHIDAGNVEATYAWYNGPESLIFHFDRNPERGVRTAETAPFGISCKATSRTSTD